MIMLLQSPESGVLEHYYIRISSGVPVGVKIYWRIVATKGQGLCPNAVLLLLRKSECVHK